MKTHRILKRLQCVALALGFFALNTTHAEDRPNILWIVAEDLSPWFGCYGDAVNAGHTPDVDQLAAEGVLFTRAMRPLRCAPPAARH